MNTTFLSPLGKVLSVVALTSGVVLASVNSASACLFSQNKGLNADFKFNPPSFNLKNVDGNTLGILGVGGVAIAGLAGYYGFKRQQSVDMTESEDFSPESFSIPVYQDELDTSVEETLEEPISSVK